MSSQQFISTSRKHTMIDIIQLSSIEDHSRSPPAGAPPLGAPPPARAPERNEMFNMKVRDDEENKRREVKQPQYSC
jgi:hypothetical protein